MTDPGEKNPGLQNVRELFDNSPLGIIYGNPEGNIAYVNESICQILGYSREELLKLTVQNLIHRDDQERTPDRVNKIYSGAVPKDKVEKHFIRNGGSLVRVRMTGSVYVEPSGEKFFLAQIEDLSHQAKLKEDLEQSQRNLEQILENSPTCMGIGSMDGKIIYVNEKMCKLLGYSKEEFKSLRIKDITHPDDQGMTSANLKRLDSESRINTGEKRYIAKDGRVLWVHGTGTTFNTATGDKVHIAQMVDITERKNALNRVEQGKQSIQKLFDDAPVGVLLSNANGRFVYVNESFSRIFGYSKEEAEKLTAKDIVYPDDLHKEPGIIRNILDGNLPTYIAERRYIHKDGELIWALVTATTHTDILGETLIITHFEDLTELKNIEKFMRFRETLNRAVIDSILGS